MEEFSEESFKLFASKVKGELFLAESCLRQIQTIIESYNPQTSEDQLKKILRENRRIEERIPHYVMQLKAWKEEDMAPTLRSSVERCWMQLNRLAVVNSHLMQIDKTLIQNIDDSWREVSHIIENMMKS